MESGQYPEEEEMSWNYVKDFMEKEGIDGRKALAVKARADVREKRVFVNVWNQAVNIGPARYVLLTKVQEHILMLHKELKFKYIRLWNIFSTRMFFRKSHQTTQLNYQYVDDVLDFCVKNHIYPLIDLGNRPETVPGSEKDLYKDVRQDMGSSHVIFQSLEEWYAIVGGFVEHIVTRYGNSEVAHWIFELWQDMSGNDFYGIQGYFTVLDSVIRLIKDKIPEAKVGGGGWGGEKQFVEGCQGILKMKNRPDFISLYLYLIHRDDMQDTNVRQYYEKDYMKNILENWTGIMKSMGLEKIKLYVTEWNLSIENHNYFNDSCGKAAMMLNVMIECMFSLDMGCYFSGTDRTLSDYDSIGILDGNLGLISKAGLKKPSWYALKFMGKMGEFPY